MVGHGAVVDTSSGPFLWWVILSAVSVLNVGLWAVAARGVRRQRHGQEPAVVTPRHQQLALSAVFVLVCGFRSVFPRADVQRICLHDSWLSSVLVGRSLATIAELCFIAQWALILREIGRDTGATFAILIARLLVPLIAVAELCSWYAVLTTSYAGNALEESIWALAATLATASAVGMWSRVLGRYRPLLGAGILFGIAYVVFMTTVDVPMYLSRWFADRASGRAYLSLAAGLRDVSRRWVVTYAWTDWRAEIPWMTLYFSVVVWVSIALMHAPRFGRRLAAPAAVGALGGAIPRGVPGRSPFVSRAVRAGRFTG